MDGGRDGFRDPPASARGSLPLEVEVARALVGATTLPVALPRFGLVLERVRADSRSVCLELSGDVVATARLTPRRAPLAPPERLEIEVGIETSGARSPALEALGARLRRAMTPARWQAAEPAIGALRALPIEPPLAFLRQLVAGVGGRQGLVRTGFRCNQDCGMCWQSRDWGGPDAAQVTRWIEDLAAAGATSLLLSGGEPTLDAALPSYVARARALGLRAVTLETNAVQLAKPGRAAALAAAGLTDAFVSLHSADARVSDAITRTPGTHARTLEGVCRLLDAGVPVTLNAVMTAEGLATLAALPAFIHATFGAHPRLKGLMLSLPTSPFDAALLDAIVPDPARVREELPRVIDRALALGLDVLGLDGPCGPQLCAFGADRRVTSGSPVTERLEFRVHVSACDGCAVRDACFGVRPEQLARFGDACVAPLVTRPR